MVLTDDARGGKVQQKLPGYLVLSPWHICPPTLSFRWKTHINLFWKGTNNGSCRQCWRGESITKVARISHSVTLTYVSSHVFPEMENTYSAIGSICFEKKPIMVLTDNAGGGKVSQKLPGYLVLSPWHICPPTLSLRWKTHILQLGQFVLKRTNHGSRRRC